MGNKKRFHFDNVYFNDPRVFEDIILYQVGDLSCAGGYEIGEHNQYCHEISYIVSGKGHFYINGQAYPVSGGDLFINRPGERHNGIADQIDPFRFFYLGYNFCESAGDASPLAHIRKMLEQMPSPVRRDHGNVQDPFVQIFGEIINVGQYTDAGQYTDLMIRSHLYRILILTYRNYCEGWEKSYQPQPEGPKSRQLVYEIINRLDARRDEGSELSRIATELGYSYAYLSRIFSQETGLGIRDYCQRKRFTTAADYLKNTPMSITEIARELHYQSIHSFSKAFRRHFGLAPTEYQALQQKDQIRNTNSSKADKDNVERSLLS